MNKYTHSDGFMDIEAGVKISDYLEKTGFSQRDLILNGPFIFGGSKEYISNEVYQDLKQIVVRLYRLNEIPELGVKCYIKGPDEVIPVFDVYNLPNFDVFSVLFNYSKDLSNLRARRLIPNHLYGSTKYFYSTYPSDLS